VEAPPAIAAGGASPSRPADPPGTRRVVVRRRTVSELMRPAALVLHPGATVRQAQQQLTRHGVDEAAVVDGNGRVLGMVTARALLRRGVDVPSAAESGSFFSDEGEYAELGTLPADPGATPVGEVMERRVATVSPDTGVAIAANILRERGLRELLVVDGGRLVGVLSALELLRVVEEVC